MDLSPVSPHESIRSRFNSTPSGPVGSPEVEHSHIVPHEGQLCLAILARPIQANHCLLYEVSSVGCSQCFLRALSICMYEDGKDASICTVTWNGKLAGPSVESRQFCSLI